MNRFDTDTAVEALGNGRYAATMDLGWWIVRGPNGGYLAAVLLRAMTEEVGNASRQPRSLTVHYLRPPVAGAVDIEVTLERSGRTLDSLTARMFQDGKLVAIALAAFAVDRDAPGFADLVMPSVPPPEQSPPMPLAPNEIPMRERYDSRWVIGPPPEPGVAHDGPTEVGGWIRLAEERPVDHLLVAALADAWAPAVFTRFTEPNPVPTIDLTVHFRHAPPPGTEWCLVRFVTRVVAGGYLEEDGEIWAADGTLLAQSRQLGVVLEIPG